MAVNDNYWVGTSNITTTGGTYTYTYPYIYYPSPTIIQVPQYGWECPRCHTCYAPYQVKCVACPLAETQPGKTVIIKLPPGAEAEIRIDGDDS